MLKRQHQGAQERHARLRHRTTITIQAHAGAVAYAGDERVDDDMADACVWICIDDRSRT